jgi:hypothetical protein
VGGGWSRLIGWVVDGWANGWEWWVDRVTDWQSMGGDDGSSECVNQSINQSISQSINRSTKQQSIESRTRKQSRNSPRAAARVSADPAPGFMMDGEVVD